MERVDISLLGRDYSLACPPSEKARLLDAVKLVDQRMQTIKTHRCYGRHSDRQRVFIC